MKKLTQICSILCLVFAFSIISANAQTMKKVKADIPFDFNLRGTQYRAGNYKLRITDLRPGVRVYLTDNKNNVLDSFLVTVAGEAPSGAPELVFNNYDGQRFLSRITTRETIYDIIRTSAERQIASRKKRADKRPEIVAIAIGY